MMLIPEQFKWFTSLATRFGVENIYFVNNNYKIIIEKADIFQKKQYLGEKTQCRYCQAFNMNVDSIRRKLNDGEISLEDVSSFKKIAHSLPTFIGNANIISKDECDTCNEKFSLFENNLVDFLGIARTTNKIRGRNGIPKFKNTKNEFVDISEGDLIIGTTEDSEMYEENNDSITITTVKKYIPIEVHKCFVKMALSVLPVEDLKDFSKTIKWLLGEEILDESYSKQLYVIQTKWPVKNIYPAVIIDIYKRNDENIDLPYMFARVCFSNYAFQFPIPLCSMDKLVNNFNLPTVIKHETPFQELLTDNNLWKTILNDTSISKINLSSTELKEEIDKQCFRKTEGKSSINLEDLPEHVIDYIKQKNLTIKT
ncbi:TPA: hypothetical protein MAC63_001392 [Klebsiella pneumoniae]|uniref:hypothetical protein n=1 Tax=Klebsiella pneumoniae complex TaxID=3390273 RepID=UPI0009BAB778|nr:MULTISPECIES: hypothetical protein [Klebsiella]MCS5935642.1 hypothetical protein [Klebsiella variicola subsp. variicola]HDS5432440.1 hypothetical protein [Klebsiella variicola]WKC70513.1 hypothetical protein KM294_08335 [Klebsiella pneumoniae]HBQ7660926.1 hypothetical protein [Klebsiella pneumoniae]HBQ7666100.1 hypothetical protein [Klebsiella pneumoniae]